MLLTDKEKLEWIDKMKRLLNAKAKSSLLFFTIKTMPNFKPALFHKHYYQALTDFALGKINKLAVFMPPQHGKSEGSTRRLPAFLLGLDPNLKIAIVSYNAPKARKFNRELQRVIDSPEYKEVFPDTCLNSKNISTLAGSWLRNADECEIVNHRGGFKTVGVGGALTGEPVDILIMDDIYKDAKSAWSPVVRESIEDWYDTVADSRLHNESRQLIVFTRWHEDDLAGRLLKLQGTYSADNPDGWKVITFEAIKTTEPNEYDARQVGEPLWPEKHNLRQLENVKKKNPHVFESLYQQNPQPAEGLMYEFGFKTYDYIPAEFTCKCYCDTADTGSDYLCAIIYLETKTFLYVVDVLYTQKSMEYTEQKLAEMLFAHKVKICNIESNNGGRSFARNVERLTREKGNSLTTILSFTQRENKQTRIFTRSAEVQNLVLFPTGWQDKWKEFSTSVLGYLKMGSNLHDDSVDALTGLVEKRAENKTASDLISWL